MPDAIVTPPDASMRRMHAVCPVCDADRPVGAIELRDHLSPERFAVVQCEVCGTRYLVDPPPPAEIGRYYETSAGAAMHRPPGRVFRALRDRRLAADLKPLVERLDAADAVADVGTGDGSLAEHLHRRGRSALALDVYPAEQWPYAAIPYRQVDLADGVPDPAAFALPGGGRPAGAVLRHVLEHVHRPVDLLRTLREAGVRHVLVVVPNVESRLARRLGTDWYYWDPPRHLTFFSAETLRRAARAAGFEAGFLRTYGLDEIATSLHRRVLIRKGPEAALASALRPTGPIAGAASILQAPVGDTVLHAVLDVR
jgi:hypothetical protein